MSFSSLHLDWSFSPFFVIFLPQTLRRGTFTDSDAMSEHIFGMGGSFLSSYSFTFQVNVKPWIETGTQCKMQNAA